MTSLKSSLRRPTALVLGAGAGTLLALASLAGAGAGGVVPAQAATVHAAPAARPSCATSGLVLWLSEPAGGGAAGSYYYDLDFTNLSGHTCVLAGYPGVSAVDLAGHQLGKAASRNPANKPVRVTLPSGATAVAILQLTDVGVFPRTSCRPTTAAGLRVYPPNQRASKIVPFPFRACAASGAVFLHVEATQKS